MTVVLPAYREGSTINRALARLLDEMDRESIDVSVVVVMDGPDDLIRKEVSLLGDQRIRIHELRVNQGKGAALKAGSIGCDSNFIAFLDADLDIHPKSLTSCLRALESTEDRSFACSYGSKFHAASVVEYPALRRCASHLFKILVQALFRMKCADTQTGVKVFRTEALLKIVDYVTENRFLFDVELLSRLVQSGYQIIEAPVHLRYQYSSTINLSSAVRMLIDLVRLRARMNAFVDFRRDI